MGHAGSACPIVVDVVEAGPWDPVDNRGPGRRGLRGGGEMGTCAEADPASATRKTARDRTGSGAWDQKRLPELNGVMDSRQFYEPPFADQQCEGLEGGFEDDENAVEIISIVKSFNKSVGVRFVAAAGC